MTNFNQLKKAGEPLLCGILYSKGGQFLYNMAMAKAAEGFTVVQECCGCCIAFTQLF